MTRELVRHLSVGEVGPLELGEGLRMLVRMQASESGRQCDVRVRENSDGQSVAELHYASRDAKSGPTEDLVGELVRGIRNQPTVTGHTDSGVTFSIC